jgi:hypothetical protein
LTTTEPDVPFRAARDRCVACSTPGDATLQLYDGISLALMYDEDL